MQQNWGTREAAGVWQERAERGDRFPNLASPVLALVALANYLTSSSPSLSVLLGEMGNHSTYLEDCENF